MTTMHFVLQSTFYSDRYSPDERNETVITTHIHDAISQVHRPQELGWSRRMSQCHSGMARLLSGSFALLGAAVLMTPSCRQPLGGTT